MLEEAKKEAFVTIEESPEREYSPIVCKALLLKEKGIPVKVWTGILPITKPWMIKVKAKDVEKAKKILSEFEKLPEDVQERFYEMCMSKKNIYEQIATIEE